MIWVLACLALIYYMFLSIAYSSFSLSVYIIFLYKTDLLWGINSCDYWSWEVQWSSVCKLETQKSSLKAWEEESRWCWFQSESEGLSIASATGRRILMSQFNSQAESEFDLPLGFFFFYSSPQWIELYPLTLGKAISFTQSMNSSDILLWKYHHRHTQK